MNLSTFIIPIPGEMSLFSVFYQIAFVIPFFILLGIGIRRKYDMASWLAILLASAFFFLIGSRIFTYSSSDWALLFQDGSWPASYDKFALGGIIIALIGLEITRRFLRFREPVLQIFAWVTPLALAIQKLGCLFSGCCYGNVTTVPWGIKYARGTLPYLDHMVNNQISDSALSSLSIHPTQIYQLALYLMISVLVLIMIKRFKSKESTIVFSLALLFISRLFLEFFIDIDATNFGSHIFWGLKSIQWLCILGALISGLILLGLEKYAFARLEYEVQIRSKLLRPILVLSVISLLFVLLHSIFSSKELVAFNIRLIIICSLFAIVFFKRTTVKRMRVFSVLILLLPVLLLSQTAKVDWSGFEKSKELSFGSTYGHYYNEVLYNPHEGSCGTAYSDIEYRYRYVLHFRLYSLS